MSATHAAAKDRHLLLAVALAAVALGAGCGRAAGPPAEPARAPAGPPVALHFEGAPPAPAHEWVGLVQAFGTGHEATQDGVLRALRERGAQMGCDAIVRVNVQVGIKDAHAIGVCARRATEERRADGRDASDRARGDEGAPR